jgi:large subunit ribosomal protein L9
MKVILNDFVEHLGERGDAVDVKPGYARNYLLPKGLAYPDTPGNRRLFEQEQKRWEDIDLKRRGVAEKLAEQLQGTELLFERRAGETETLFGSVTTHDIAGALADRGVEIDRRRIDLPEPIKAIGSYTIAINVYRDLKVEIKAHVVRPGEQPGEAESDEVAEEAIAEVPVEAAEEAAEPAAEA